MCPGVMNEHIYKYDEVVVGSSLSAVTYAYLTNSKILMNGDAPFFFESFENDVDLSKINFRNEARHLHGFKVNKTVGKSKLEVWQRLSYINSVAGLTPMSDKIESIRLSDDSLRITTKNFRLIKIQFDRLRIFDDEKISGLQPHKKSFAKYKVLDWVNVHSGMIHEYDFLNSSIDFVRDIHFYPSNRIDGRHDKKDLVAVSYLSEDQLKDFDFSDTVAKFKILKLMKQAGIRGARNGRDQLNPNKYKYYSLKARTTKREIMKGKMPKYENEENIIFDYRTEEQVLEEESKNHAPYFEKIAGDIF